MNHSTLTLCTLCTVQYIVQVRPSGSGGGKEPKDRAAEKASKPSEPFKMSLPKSKIKLTLNPGKATTKPNSAVLEKLGMTNEDLVEARKAAKRKQELEKIEAAAAAKKARMEARALVGGGDFNAQSLMDTLKERLKNKIEAGKNKSAAAATLDPSGEVSAKAKDGKKVKGKEGPEAKGRREELLKQLKAVEDAIHRKRTKLDG